MPVEGVYEGSYSVQGGDFEAAGEVASRIKKALKGKGFPESVLRRVAIVTFEAEVNIISYAEQGSIQCTANPEAVVIRAVDRGPGIEDVELARQEGYSTADDRIREMGFGAGMGLNNIQKFSDTFEIYSRLGKGTFLKIVIGDPADRRGSARQI